MKVLFTFSGMPHYLIALLNRLHAYKDLEVTVIIPHAESNLIGAGVKQVDSGIHFRIIHLPEYKAFYGKNFFKDLKNTIRNESPDIIVTGWPYIMGLVFYPRLTWFLKKQKIKLLYREIPFQVPKLGNVFKYYRNTPLYDENMEVPKRSRVSLLFFVCFITVLRKIYYSIIDGTLNYADDGKEIQTSYGVHPQNIFVTYNSPDTDVLFKAKDKIKNQPPLLPANPHRIIHVGRLVAWKRVDILIKVFSDISGKYPSAELVIIGTGPEEEKLRNLVRQFRLEKQVVFAGGVYDPELLGRYLTDSSIYVLAGMGGLSLNEAMLFGKPVICSICDGTEKALVIDKYNGFYFKEGDSKDLGDKIEKLLEDPELMKQMGENSEKIIREKININTVVDKMYDAFQAILNKK